MENNLCGICIIRMISVERKGEQFLISRHMLAQLVIGLDMACITRVMVNMWYLMMGSVLARIAMSRILVFVMLFLVGSLMMLLIPVTSIICPLQSQLRHMPRSLHMTLLMIMVMMVPRYVLMMKSFESMMMSGLSEHLSHLVRSLTCQVKVMQLPPVWPKPATAHILPTCFFTHGTWRENMTW